MKKLAAASYAEDLGYSPEQFIKLAIQDSLAKSGFHYSVEITSIKKIASAQKVESASF